MGELVPEHAVDKWSDCGGVIGNSRRGAPSAPCELKGEGDGLKSFE